MKAGSAPLESRTRDAGDELMRGEEYLACVPRNTGIERQICALEEDKESMED